MYLNAIAVTMGKIQFGSAVGSFDFTGTVFAAFIARWGFGAVRQWCNLLSDEIVGEMLKSVNGFSRNLR